MYKLTFNPRETYASHIPALVSLMKRTWDQRPPTRVTEWRCGHLRELLRRVARKTDGCRERAAIADGAEVRSINKSNNNKLHGRGRSMPAFRKFDTSTDYPYSALYDSPLAGSFDWLLPGAGKPPSGRFSHFRASDSFRQPLIESLGVPGCVAGCHLLHMACLRWAGGVRYAVINIATTLSALSEGIAQPWWLFYVRGLGADRTGLVR